MSDRNDEIDEIELEVEQAIFAVALELSDLTSGGFSRKSLRR